MDRQEALISAARELLLEPTDFKKLYEELVAHINDMLQHDFDRLLGILYRIDVSEARLRYMLQSNPDTDAATLIANLIIERQWQKIKTRQEFRRDDNIDENERW
jgi:DNA/RNA endonuclease G (NUC1)